MPRGAGSALPTTPTGRTAHGIPSTLDPRRPVSGLARKAVDAGGELVDRLRGDTPGPDARRSLTVGRPADELRALWGNPEHLGHILAEPYTGHPSPWTAEVRQADEIVAFEGRSGQEEPLRATGTVSFAPAPQDLGTVVTLELHLDGPDPAAGATAAKALRRAKALAETGEIPTLAGNVSGRGHDHDDEEA